MAFEGYLLKVGEDIFPNKYIEINSYKAKTNVQDLNPERDANGVLKRSPLEHSVITVKFNTPNGLSNVEVENFMRLIRKNYLTTELEKKVKVTAWMQGEGKYVTQDCYLVDIEFPAAVIQRNKIYYDSINLEFIGY